MPNLTKHKAPSTIHYLRLFSCWVAELCIFATLYSIVQGSEHTGKVWEMLKFSIFSGKFWKPLDFVFFWNVFSGKVLKLTSTPHPLQNKMTDVYFVFCLFFCIYGKNCFISYISYGYWGGGKIIFKNGPFERQNTFSNITGRANSWRGTVGININIYFWISNIFFQNSTFGSCINFFPLDMNRIFLSVPVLSRTVDVNGIFSS